MHYSDAYPSPKSSPLVISSDEVASLVRNNTPDQREYAVIDVRRNDHVVRTSFVRRTRHFADQICVSGGSVRGSAQWPAQTFYDHLPDFLEKFEKTAKVIFYCNGSSGRAQGVPDGMQLFLL